MDAEQVGMIGPAEYEFLADACGLGHFAAAGTCGALVKEVVGSLDTGFIQLGGINVADSFNVYNFVCHSSFLF